jgi:methylated-DNA-[protein]-cysteine S-methyltransferase
VASNTSIAERQVIVVKSNSTPSADHERPVKTSSATPVGQGVLVARGLGPLALTWSKSALLRLDFIRGTGSAQERGDEVPVWLSRPLEAYFDGAPIDPIEIPVELEGSEFELAVWNELRTIRRGEVRTYASVARAVGSPRGMRAVGGANGRNPIPIVVPCHRVIAQGSRLGGYTSGLDRKRFLLALEGVLVEQDRVYPGQLVLERTSRNRRAT